MRQCSFTTGRYSGSFIIAQYQMHAFSLLFYHCVFYVFRTAYGFFPTSASGGGHATMNDLGATSRRSARIRRKDPTLSISITRAQMLSHADLPIARDEEAAEYQKYLCSEFEYLLAIGQSPQRVVTYEGYRKWDEVGILLRFGGTPEMLDEAWEKAVGSTKDVADFSKFTDLYKLLPFALPMELGAGPSVKMNDYLEYVKKEFTKISIVLKERANGGLLSFDTFMRWGEVDAIIAEGFLSKSALEKIWIKCVGSLSIPCNLPQFLELNNAMDECAE